MFDIYYLHTGQVHVNTFEALSHKLASDDNLTLNVGHRVEADYLKHAQLYGCDRGLKQTMLAALEQMQQQAKLVVCTCSSIGEIAEQAASDYGYAISRIDRAMADQAVKHSRLLVLATLASTLEPTCQLLTQSAQNQGETITMDTAVIDGAFDMYMSGQQGESLALIRSLILNVQSDYDAIVLAQASMAGAVEATQCEIPIYSSPYLGVQAAIAAIKAIDK
ncbi:amino-acid racemase [Alginatibacterium sediminis]|uniref:Amino-acid racemase n=1 Tax=Alginatibacterium sediminis TaxID=2164068 RepID=A0A420EDM6_9ALTE|nr:amino-acid racemase [Alginatibacterium sediminis]RKF18768.1 amino-acid racemase [Alginatibacterium sediminis]